MGQIQSEEYQLDEEDVGDSELNSTPTTPSANPAPPSAAAAAANQVGAKQGVAVGVDANTNNNNNNNKTIGPTKSNNSSRKLSNVSQYSRNIQLLSMKPKSEKEAYADGLRSRRRSSLINLILGAPSSGPRFSDDLCSLSSHQLSEFNFGIEFFPDGSGLAKSSSNFFDDLICNNSGGGDLEKGGGNPRQGYIIRNAYSNCPQVGSENSAKTTTTTNQNNNNCKSRRRSSLGSLAAIQQQQKANSPGEQGELGNKAPSTLTRLQQFRKPSLSSMLASIDLTSSFEQHDMMTKSVNQRPPLCKAKQTIFESLSQESLNNQQVVLSGDNSGGYYHDLRTRASKGRLNQAGRVLRRTGSELSLYSTISGCSSTTTTGSAFSQQSSTRQQYQATIKSKSSSSDSKTATNNIANDNNPMKETKLIIMLQVCLPFIFAGFGNMAAGLVLNQVAHWEAFRKVPIFFVLLPSFVGLKGNIEMTLASRLSTLSNLNLLETSEQRRQAYLSNLVLILSQAIGLSLFATTVAILCELLFIHGGGSSSSLALGKGGHLIELLELCFLVVLASALISSILLVLTSSIIMSMAICLARLIQVNPDNLSTLIAALYGDVSCVFVYGLIANLMFSLRLENNYLWPSIIICSTLVIWPILLYIAYKFKETHSIALSSIPPMLTSILISMGSGAVLSIVVNRFRLIALYQPVVNGFGANLIAVQASRVSTWLWCSALGRMSRQGQIENYDYDESMMIQSRENKPSGSLATFTPPAMQTTTTTDQSKDQTNNNQNKKPPKPSLLKLTCKLIKLILWSFFNSSPNSIAARLLLLMLIPAHSLYFFVIWFVSPANYINLTFAFYFTYIGLCLVQVFILLTLCEPLMTLLMKRHLDPDIFGISILMALADLIGTLCLTGAFYLLSSLGDANGAQQN